MIELTDTQARAKRFAAIFLAIMCLGSLVLDQATKIHSERELMKSSHPEDLKQYRGSYVPVWSTGSMEKNPLQPASPEEFFLGFNLSYVRNQGAAWGFLSNLDDSIRIPFFYCVTLAAVILLFFYLKNTPLSHRLARFSLVLILSGALGNFLDRVRLGYVIDWIDVRWNILGWHYEFPNFNFADSAISVGIFFLLIDMAFLEQRRKKDAEKEVALQGSAA